MRCLATGTSIHTVRADYWFIGLLNCAGPDCIWFENIYLLQRIDLTKRFTKQKDIWNSGNKSIAGKRHLFNYPCKMIEGILNSRLKDVFLCRYVGWTTIMSAKLQRVNVNQPKTIFRTGRIWLSRPIQKHKNIGSKLKWRNNENPSLGKQVRPFCKANFEICVH